MATSKDSDTIPVDQMLQKLNAAGIDVSTFLDEGIRPREPPDPSKPKLWLREGQTDTRIREPHEYPDGILSGIYDLVKEAGTVDAAKAVLKTAVQDRKGLVGQAGRVVQVLYRDFRAAMKILAKNAASHETTSQNKNKRAAHSPPSAERPQKQRPPNEPIANGNKNFEDDPSQVGNAKPLNFPSVVKRMEDVPEALAKTLKIMSNLQKGPAARPEVARRFNSEQSESELYALHINCTTILRATSIQDEEFGIRQGTEVHSRKHWMFKLFANEASKLYKKLNEETGLVLSKQLRNIFETPLQCCANCQPKEAGEIKPQ